MVSILCYCTGTPIVMSSIIEDFTWHTFFEEERFPHTGLQRLKLNIPFPLIRILPCTPLKISSKDIPIVILIVTSIHTMRKWLHLLSACIICIVHGRCLWACLFKIADCFVLVVLKQMTTWRYFSWLQILCINLTACTQLVKNVLASSRHLGP